MTCGCWCKLAGNMIDRHVNMNSRRLIVSSLDVAGRLSFFCLRGLWQPQRPVIILRSGIVLTVSGMWGELTQSLTHSISVTALSRSGWRYSWILSRKRPDTHHSITGLIHSDTYSQLGSICLNQSTHWNVFGRQGETGDPGRIPH